MLYLSVSGADVVVNWEVVVNFSSFNFFLTEISSVTEFTEHGGMEAADQDKQIVLLLYIAKNKNKKTKKECLAHLKI